MNIRGTACFAALLAGLGFAVFASTGAAGTGNLLHGGDTVRIAGTSTGCAVAKRGGNTVVECTPMRRSPGAYGTIIGDTQVIVVRFRSPSVAKTVFAARQHSTKTTTCK
jgi:hypothetical protein